VNNASNAAPILLLLAALYAANEVRAGRFQEQSNPPTGQSEPARQESPSRLRVEHGVALIKKVNPEYPKKARSQHVQGTVVLNATISKEGDIADLTVVSGDPLLVKAAVKAVKQWKYRPYLVEGKPVELDTEIRVNFELSGD
jgi:protein TonB